MKFRTGLAITAVVVGLGASSVAMDHARDHNRDHGLFHRAALHQNDRDRKGYEKSKKTGWNDGALPPGKAKSQSKMWQKEHKGEAKAHRREMKQRQHEARTYRHQSHPAVAHKQPRLPVNAQKQGAMSTMREAAKANKQHQQELQHH